MASSSASQYFEIPKFFLFSEKGIYSGSSESRDFNYKVVPKCPKEGDKILKAFVWSGKNCIDKTEDVTEKDFEFSQEGYNEMLKWLEDTFLARPETKTVIENQQQHMRDITEKYVSLEDFFDHQTNTPKE